MSGGKAEIPPNLGSLFRPASEYGPGGVKLVNGKPCPEDESAKKKCIGEDGKEITPEWAQEEEVHRRLFTEIREAESRGDLDDLPGTASSEALPTSSRPYDSSQFALPHANGHAAYAAQPHNRERGQGSEQPGVPGGGPPRPPLAGDPAALFAFPSLVGAIPTGPPTVDDIIYRASVGDTFNGLIAGGTTFSGNGSLRDAKSVQSQL